MHFLKIITVLAVCVLAFAQCAIAESQKEKVQAKPSAVAVTSMQRTKTGPLAGVDVTTVEIVAVIEKLDVEKREITLKTTEGKTKSLKVSDKVKRLAEFKVGDKITVLLYEALAFEVRKPTAAELENPSVVMKGVSKNTTSLPPGVDVGMLSHTIVTIKAIDLKQNSVTIQFPEGDSATLQARVPENLKRVKVGDTVAITYAEGLAISLSKSEG